MLCKWQKHNGSHFRTSYYIFNKDYKSYIFNTDYENKWEQNCQKKVHKGPKKQKKTKQELQFSNIN